MNVGSGRDVSYGGRIRTELLPVTVRNLCRSNSTHFTEILRVSENRVAREACGPQRDEVTRDWRTLDNEELHNFNFPSNSIVMITSGSMGWARHVARTGENRIQYRI
jgi:hypothetical protein